MTIPDTALLLYHREGDLLRYKTTGMTNHELRELMVGIWARLDAADRVDHIRELQSYQTDQDGWLSQVASGIARGVAGIGPHVDLKAMDASDLLTLNLAEVEVLLTKDLPR